MKKKIIQYIRSFLIKKRRAYYDNLGITIGKNSKIEKDVFIDTSFPWLIKIGNNVTIAPRTFILAHDGSTKNYLGYSKIGRVVIKDNVFIGANCTILPNVTIGQNSIVGAGSIVTRDVPDNVVVVGNPAKVISSIDEFKEKNKNILQESRIYENTYKRNVITGKMKISQFNELEDNIAFID